MNINRTDRIIIVVMRIIDDVVYRSRASENRAPVNVFQKGFRSLGLLNIIKNALGNQITALLSLIPSEVKEYKSNHFRKILLYTKNMQSKGYIILNYLIPISYQIYNHTQCIHRGYQRLICKMSGNRSKYVHLKLA